MFEREHLNEFYWNFKLLMIVLISKCWLQDRRSYRLQSVGSPIVYKICASLVTITTLYNNGETADSTVALSGPAAFCTFMKHFMSIEVPSQQTKNGTPIPGIRKICWIHRFSEFLFCSESSQLNIVFHYVVVWSLVFQKKTYCYVGF